MNIRRAVCGAVAGASLLACSIGSAAGEEPHYITREPSVEQFYSLRTVDGIPTKTVNKTAIVTVEWAFERSNREAVMYDSKQPADLWLRHADFRCRLYSVEDGKFLRTFKARARAVSHYADGVQTYYPVVICSYPAVREGEYIPTIESFGGFGGIVRSFAFNVAGNLDCGDDYKSSLARNLWRSKAWHEAYCS